MADDASKGFRFVPPEDSLRDDDARFTAHIVVICVVVGLGLTLASALTMMSVMYWG